MVRRIRLVVLAVATFLTITARAFLKKTVVLALCGILSFNAAICYGYFSRSIKATAVQPPANTDPTAIVTHDKEVAQIRIPGLDLPVPKSGSINDLLKGIVAERVLKLIGNEAPIVSSADDIFPTVSSLPGVPFTPKRRSSVDDDQETLVAALPESLLPSPSLTLPQDIAEIPRIRRQNRETSPATPANDNAPVQPGKTTDTSRYPFNPTGNVSQLVAQLRQSSDGSVLLKPGDYEIPITLYCMKQRVSSPAGHRYLLAPLKGSKADVISALNAKAAGSDIPHGKLQTLSWNIQAGMKYEDMSPDQQGLVNQMIPGSRDKLSRSFLEQVEAGYNQIAAVSNLPSLDAAIDRLGEAGAIIRQYKEFRSTLVRYRDNYQALLEELVPGSGSRVVGGAANTPWSKINNQVYARMITQEKVGGTGELQMRVLPSSASDSSPVRVGITNIVADSQTNSIQPLTGSPQPPPPSQESAQAPCPDVEDFQISQHPYLDPSYDPFSRPAPDINRRRFGTDYHYYNPPLETQICSTSNPSCTRKRVFEAMLSQRRFMAPAEEKQKSPVEHCSVTNLQGPGRKGWVGSIRYSDYIVNMVDQNTFTAINYTLDPAGPGNSHIFHPGRVIRTVIERDGNIIVRTEGEGTGQMPRTNETEGRALFESIDQQLKSHVESLIR